MFQKWGLVAVGLVVAGVAPGAGFAAGGTFERWVGGSSGWVSNDAETATLTKKLTVVRARLPGNVQELGSDDEGFEVWLNVGCRARNPEKRLAAWISLSDHPDQKDAVHWLAIR